MRTDRDPTVPNWRRLPIGAEPAPAGGVHFRVWAPKRGKAAVLLENGQAAIPLSAEPGGYFSGLVPTAKVGALYRYQLDSAESFPDPASRFQPSGPHGPSMVVDPGAFRWTDGGWPGVSPPHRVIYELHVGTFTGEGTWQAAAGELASLRALGITLLEVMPVAEFGGRFGWGYDGVNLFAPHHHYGTPDDFRRFVDRAHALGLGVILDVVYNHFGPDGNYLRLYADEYFSARHTTDWGEAVNFDGAGCAAVRQLCLANARHWIVEYHLDGLRLDATQDIHDESAQHIIGEIVEEARAAAPERTLFLVAENEPQHASYVREVRDGGFGLDAMWNDDWHHSAMVALTGRSEAYYTDYRGTAHELVAAAKFGFLYQGQWYGWQRQPRGTPTFGLDADRFVHFLQNHDQVANSFRGDRIHALTSPALLRAMTALLLLGPQLPMLFQGQEFAASTPFVYFADHSPELMRLVHEGRKTFLSQFDSMALPAIAAALPDPGDPANFARCKLDHAERTRHHAVYTLHRDLLALRRTDAVLAASAHGRRDAAALNEQAFVIRFFGTENDDRLLLVNLGGTLHLDRMPEPLLAPPERMMWTMTWSSEDPKYGGLGAPRLAPSMEDWDLPGGCAALLAADVTLAPDEDGTRAGR
jgi:maltooligosyltrehalose trehalohydrolase